MTERLNKGTFRRGWTPETWDWNPEEERWSPKHGRPRGCVFFEVSTKGISRQEAYDYWRETVFYHFAADREKPTGNAGFSAHAQGIIAPRGEFYCYGSDAVSGQRTLTHARQDGGDDFDIGLVLVGTRFHQPDADTAYTADPGEPFFYDCTHASRLAWTAHRGLHLRLRRSVIEAGLGKNIPQPSVLAREVPTSRLWPFLQAQLTLLARNLSTLSNSEQEMLLDNTIDLSLLVLRTLNSDFAVQDETGSTRHGLFVAAQRFIASNLSNPDLNAAAVADAIGCSRATLYRVFAQHELAVAAYIREQRLQRFLRLLQTANDDISVTVVAERCGFHDGANVSKKFRQRFGMSPRDARREGHLTKT